VIANLLVGLVAVIHAYIVVLEMLLWDKPQCRKAFGTTPEFAGLVLGDAGNPVKIFFLGCVIVAGLMEPSR
jgi:putative membrane protein